MLPCSKIGKYRIIGLTGGIAMGKSAVTLFLRKNKFSVFDADAEVHKLYAKSRNVHKKISSICSQSVDDTGVNRAKLSEHLSRAPEDLRRIEAIIQPALAKAFEAFYRLKTHKQRTIFIDAPLLIEGNYWRLCDCILTFSAPKRLQTRRTHVRPSLSIDKAKLLMSRQMQDNLRRARSDLVIPTGLGHSYTRRYLSRQLARLQNSWRTSSEAPRKPRYGAPPRFPRRVRAKQGLVPGSMALKKHFYATKTKGSKA